MRSDLYDSKCNRAFYSHHIDLKKHFYTFMHINNYCNCNFVILVDNTNFWLSTQISDCQHKFLIVNNKFLIVNKNTCYFWRVWRSIEIDLRSFDLACRGRVFSLNSKDSFIHSFNLFYPRYPFRYKIPDLPRRRAKNIIVYTSLIIK